MKEKKGSSRRAVVFSALSLACAARVFARAAEAEPEHLRHFSGARVPFVENTGQMEPRVAFAAPTFFGRAVVTHSGRLTYFLRASQSGGSTLTETFVRGMPRLIAGAPASTRISHFLGSDPTRWRSNLPVFDEILLGDVWPGVAVSLRAHAGSVEKVFTVAPGARAESIRLHLEGASSLRVDRDGVLVALTAGGEVRFTAPVAYQEGRAGRPPVRVTYVVRGSTYGFRLGIHDPELPVVIDPILQSTYVGGADADSVNAIAIDPASGDVIVAGHSYSNPGHGVDGFVARFDSTLQTLRHFTYLGGGGGDEILGLAVHPVTGDVYVGGFTSSDDFPGTSNGEQPERAGSNDGFVARFDSSLTRLLGATYFGGGTRDRIVAIAIGSTGDVFVAGYTDGGDLPGTAGGAQADFEGGGDGFIARFDATLARLGQATYLGLGVNTDLVRSMAIHPWTGDILVGGQSGGGDYYAGYLVRMASTLTGSSSLMTVNAAASVDVFGIAVDPHSGDIYATGWVHDLSGADGGAQPQPGGGPTGVDGFVLRIDPTMSTVMQATYIGGAENDYGYGIAVHPSNGDIYVTGQTFSADLPGTTNGAQPSPGGGSDGFVARLDSTLAHIVQSTYLGSSGDDVSFAIAIHPSSGEIIVAGTTSSTNFPESRRGAQAAFAGGDAFLGGDGFVTRLSPSLWDASHECTLHPDQPCLNGREPDPVDVVHTPRLATRPGKVSPLAQEQSSKENAP